MHLSPVVSCTKSPSTNENSFPPELVQNSPWAASIFKTEIATYSTKPALQLPPLVVTEYPNSYDITPDEALPGRIDTPTIMQFLQRASLRLDQSMSFDFLPISTVSNFPSYSSTSLQIPSQMSIINAAYLRVSLPGKITFHGSSQSLSGIIGAMFLFDFTKKEIVSEPAIFAQKETTIFSLTKTDTVDFRFNPENTNIRVVCILMHSGANNLSRFLEDFKGTNLPPIPFALSYSNPFDASARFKFPWILLDKPNSLQALFTSTDESTPVSIVCKINIQRLTDSPKYVDRFPQEICDLRPSIFLTKLVFSLPKEVGDNLFFKAFLVNYQALTAEPDSIKAFPTRDGLINVYKSFVMQKGKILFFPDVVKLEITKPFSPQTHIVFHLCKLVKGVETPLYFTAFPFFDENGTFFGTSSPTLNLMEYGSVKNDYLIKVKSPSKSTLSFKSHSHPLLCPPKSFTSFFALTIPSLIDTDEIRQMPSQELQPLLIPIISKLLSLIHVNSLTLFIQLVANQEVDLIRAWIYHNFAPQAGFLAKFVGALDAIIQKEIEKSTELSRQLTAIFDILADIIIVLVVNYGETFESQTLCRHITELICISNIRELNQHFGEMVFDLSDYSIIRPHLQTLLKNQKDLFVMEFLLPFTNNTDFATACVCQVPVRTLPPIMFSPYHAVISTISLSLLRCFSSADSTAIEKSVVFMTRLLLPMELAEAQLCYRAAFAFFPFLEVISSLYEAVLTPEQQFQLLPAVLFLLTYTPAQLLKNFFATVSSNYQCLFIKFLDCAAHVCVSKIESKQTSANGLFDQLTQRILQFLSFNISKYNECLPNVVSLVSVLANTPYQTTRNFPRMFDIISRLIRHYPAQRQLVVTMLEIVSSPQHIARCFATSLIVLFFKADFDEKRSVVVSSVEILDALTSILLLAPVEDIGIYKLMLARINSIVPCFKLEALTTKIDERLRAATNIAEVIEKMRLAAQPTAEHCLNVMEIADQYWTFPSMRLKWLKEIVQINLNAHCYSAAFVCQLHICELVRIVYEKMNSPTPITFSDSFNDIVTQPIRHSIPTDSRQVVLSTNDFMFFPSVAVEKKINFDDISEDFQFIASDFSLDLLFEAIQTAIDIGERATLFYSIRPLLSLQLRMYSALHDFEKMAKVSKQLATTFANLTASEGDTHDSHLSFYLVGHEIYCLDEGAEIPPNGIKLNKHEAVKSLEHPHCWNTFRNQVPTLSEQITLSQYVTKDFLPRFTSKSEVEDESNVTISLYEYAKLETGRMVRLMQQNSSEFERCFPVRKLDQIPGNYNQNIEGDLIRIVQLFNSTVKSEHYLSMIRMLDDIQKKELAQLLLPNLERLIKVYHRAIEYLMNSDHFLAYKNILDAVNAFKTEFVSVEAKLDSSSYTGYKDPLTEHFSYE